MENNLQKLASIVSLPSEISVPTEIKTPISELLDTAHAIREDMKQFEVEEVSKETPLSLSRVEHKALEETEEDYDAEKEARSLVYTMHAIDQFVLNIAVLIKCRISAGGSKGLEKMKAALTKEVIGEELTEQDKSLIARFKQYKSNMETLSGEMLIKEDELNRLISVATDYCAESKIKIGTGTAFWTNYFGSLAGRVTKIIIK